VPEAYLQDVPELISRINTNYPFGCLKLLGTIEHPMSGHTSLTFVYRSALNYGGSPASAVGELADAMVNHSAQAMKFVPSALMEFGNSRAVEATLAKIKWPSRKSSKKLRELQETLARFLRESN